MPRETSPGALRTVDFRSRRSHEKSRGGCVRCKQQRKKCDEVRPSCSRCSQHKYCCQYLNKTLRGPDVAEETTLVEPARSDMLESPPSIVFSASDVSLALSDGFLSAASSSPNPPSPFHTVLGDRQDPLPSPNILNATELELLSHYLTHTSRTIPFDEDDLYALSVGIPNMAFGSKPVMSSMLALAATCKSHSIVKQNAMSLQSLDEIRELLTLAHRHHQDSLEQIQADISNAKSYDCILANAALMVLYSSASHCVRTKLAEMARRNGIDLPREILPQGSQWISLIRAAHTASSSVLNTIADISGELSPGDTASASGTSPASQTSASYREIELSPEDGPSEGTKRLFLPIVSSSYRRALERLRQRVQSTVASQQHWHESELHQAELEACVATLPMLKNAAQASFSTNGETSKGENTHQGLDAESIPFDRLSKVSPWLGRYLARVTSLTSPKPLRRTIMSFLNQAPLQYLSLVQSVLDAIPTEGNTTDEMSWESDNTGAPRFSVPQLLAMDIFAHWLVLVMLLDGVWWIGDLGQWELGRAVSLIKSQDWLDHSFEGGEAWWPESMYRVKRELMQHM